MIALGIAPLAQGFRDRADDPERALQRCIAAADSAQGDRAILWRVARAERDAAAAAKRFAEGRPLGPLDGIPLVVKDCIDMAGLPSTNGTCFLTNPVAEDAELIRRLGAAGAVIFAKCNMHEFGIQPTGVNPHYGTPVNPWAPDRIPGGSSSGVGVAVASGIAPAGVGTDAGGSVRIPAALCGLVGLKPTYGAIPSGGVTMLTKDLDHVGPIAWTVDDAILLFEVMSGQTVRASSGSIRAATLRDLFDGCEEAVSRAVRSAIAEVFGKCADAPTPMSAWAAAVEFVIVGTDASELGGSLLETHGRRMGADTRTILQLGRGLSREDRGKADRMRSAIRAELNALLQAFDVLLAPAAGAFAPKLHPGARHAGELDTRAIAQLSAVAYPANLTGLPSVAVPCTRVGLPAAMQIIGRLGEEGTVLAAARQVEARFGPRRPPRWYGVAMESRAGV